MNDGRTFCDPMWSLPNANVACIQLGYSGANSAYWNNSHFGVSESLPGGKPIERKYNCTGTEGSLKECFLLNVDSEKTCEKQKAVSVTCKYKALLFLFIIAHNSSCRQNFDIGARRLKFITGHYAFK